MRAGASSSSPYRTGDCRAARPASSPSPVPDARRGPDVSERDLQLVDDAGFLGLRHRASPLFQPITPLLTLPERAEGAVLAVREVLALLVRAPHVALGHGDR